MDQLPVLVGDTEFYVEVAQTGPQPVALGDRLSFDGVRDTVQAIADQLNQVWERSRPTEASVEFALKLTSKGGRLTGLLVDGSAEAALKVTLTWRRAEGQA
ncbi:CU044_2847 family protein [Streptomyces polyrhachis]|uniref:CU044_2847 family protein n=1 Tax=Streptomyces polyrhachis TaxID=1282885 RepID=A0ABW2GH43_9ACTN